MEHKSLWVPKTHFAEALMGEVGRSKDVSDRPKITGMCSLENMAG